MRAGQAAPYHADRVPAPRAAEELIIWLEAIAAAGIACRFPSSSSGAARL